MGLCISLALITLLASIAIPSFFGRADVTLDNAAELLASDIRSGQNRAAFLKRQVSLHFYDAGDGYWIDDEVSIKNAEAPLIANRIYSENAVFEDVRISDVARTEAGPIQFGTNGTATNSARITLSLGEATRTLTISAPIGRLTIEGTTRAWVDDGY